MNAVKKDAAIPLTEEDLKRGEALLESVMLNAMDYHYDPKTMRVDISSKGTQKKKWTPPQDELETSLSMTEAYEWDAPWMDSFFSVLRKFEYRLKSHSDIPNLEKIKAAKSEREATIFNLWYHYAIHHKVQDVYDAIEKMPDWRKDARLVFLRGNCARDLKHDFQERLELCDHLIQLDPKRQQQRYRHIKLALEYKAGVAAKRIVPPEPSAELVEFTKTQGKNAEEVLRKMEKIRKWDTMGLEICMSALHRFAKELEGKADLPNLAALRKRNSERDCQVLNLWYRFTIGRQRQEVYDAIERIPEWRKDARLVYLKVIAGDKLNRDKRELLELCDLLLKLEPNNGKFPHMRLIIEMK
ncbi:MAG: hypothetical protein IJJ33_00140 [Victivallales bacterium]|nr:hypothetical protein [Victivallales bacterium]